MARTAHPTDPATTIQAAAIMRPVHPTRSTTGSRGGAAGRPLAGRPFAVPVFRADPLPLFFF